MQLCDVTDSIGLRDRAMLEVLYSTGLRRMEMIALKLYDLELDRGLILSARARATRTVMFPSASGRLLAQEVHPRGPSATRIEPDDMTVFLTAQGEPFSRDHLSFAVKERIDAAQLGKTGSCHLFRHTMATLMHENGADIRFIQQMLGHEDLKTTQIYTQVAIRTLQQVHAATHPAALLEGHPANFPPVTEQSGPGAEALFSTLEAEAEEDREVPDE